MIQAKNGEFSCTCTSCKELHPPQSQIKSSHIQTQFHTLNKQHKDTYFILTTTKSNFSNFAIMTFLSTILHLTYAYILEPKATCT